MPLRNALRAALDRRSGAGRRAVRFPRRLAAFASLALLLALVPVPDAAAAGRGKGDRTYSTEELIRGFMLTVFGREGPASRDGAERYVNKFVDPVPVFVLNSSPTVDRSPDVERFVQRLAKTVPNLPIRTTHTAEDARMFVFLTNRRDYRSVISNALAGGRQAAFMEENYCSAIMWDRTTGVLDLAYVFIVVDEGEDAFRGCLVEEITQALGPANDSSQLPHSIFNDDSKVSRFELFDWFILSALYDPDVLAGMTRDEVARVLPGVIEKLRTKAVSVRKSLG